MIKYLYPKPISVHTVPKAGKQYGLRFTWRATEDLTERNISDAFEVVAAYFEADYPVRVLRIISAPEAGLQPEIQFVVLREIGLAQTVTLNDLWNRIEQVAIDHYLELTFKEAVIYRPRFPWWLLAIAAAEAGGIVYVAKKKR